MTDILANDRLPAASVRWEDDDGRLHVDRSAVTRVQVAPYYGNEVPGWEERGLDPTKIYRAYRPESELQDPDTIASLIGIPIQLDHHPDYPDAPAMHTRVGSTGDAARYEAPYLIVSLHIQNADAIRRIKDGSMRELSLSYHYCPDFTPGTTPDGQQYDFVMRRIRAQHLALVESGRAGEQCRVDDHALTKGVHMNDETNAPEGVKHEADHEAKEVAAAEAIAEKADEIRKLHEVAEDEDDAAAAVEAQLKDQGFTDEDIAIIRAAYQAPAQDEDACDEGEEQPAAGEGEAADEEEACDEGEEQPAEDEGEEIAEALKAAGLNAEDPAQQKALGEALKALLAKRSADHQEVAQDTARRVVKMLEAKQTAAEETVRSLGKIRTAAFDSAGAIYLAALKAEGVPTKGMSKSAARSAYCAFMAGKKKAVRATQTADDSAVKTDAMSRLFSRVTVH